MPQLVFPGSQSFDLIRRVIIMPQVIELCGSDAHSSRLPINKEIG